MSSRRTFRDLQEENERLRFNAKAYRNIAIRLAKDVVMIQDPTEEDARRYVNELFEQELKKER